MEICTPVYTGIVGNNLTQGTGTSGYSDTFNQMALNVTLCSNCYTQIILFFGLVLNDFVLTVSIDIIPKHNENSLQFQTRLDVLVNAYVHSHTRGICVCEHTL